MKKVLTILTALTLSLLPAAGSLKTSAAGAWDGKTADIGFYAADPAAAEFVIETPEEYAGLCEIAFIKNAGTASGIKGDGKLYYDTDGMVVTDPANADESRCVNGTDFMGKTIRLGKNIDLASKPIKPLGYPKCFYGILDGNGKTISNLNPIGSSVESYGRVSINGAGLFGYVYTGGVIKNVTVEGTLAAVKFSGGIVAILANGTVENCISKLTITLHPDCTDGYDIGGIVGSMKDYTSKTAYVVGCRNEGNITIGDAGRYVGGIVGEGGYGIGIVNNTTCRCAVAHI